MDLNFEEVNDLNNVLSIDTKIYDSIRKYTFEILEDRNYNLNQRLSILGRFLELVNYQLDDIEYIDFEEIAKDNYLYYFP